MQELIKKSTVLFVDDEPLIFASIRRMARAYADRWTLRGVNSVAECMAVAKGGEVDLIVTDMSMPGESGLDLLKQVAQREDLVGIPVVMLTGDADLDLKRQALDLGALDLLNKPINASELIARISSALRLREAELKLRNMNSELERLVAERTADLEHSRLEVVWRLAKAGQLRDTETGEHLIRVATLSKAIALDLGMSERDATDLFYASSLHDIGKIGISDLVLHKPSALTEKERETIQEHCKLGHDILAGDLDLPSLPRSQNKLLSIAATIALSHHERWDGAGYPSGLNADSIPLEARIVAVADVFDALCSERPYKKAMSPAEAAAFLQEQSGSHFDPDVVTSMLKVMPEIAREFAAASSSNWGSEGERSAA